MPDSHLPSSPSDRIEGLATTRIEPVVCLACGCDCDDLVVTQLGEKLAAVEPRCELAESWFRGSETDEQGLPVADVAGRPASTIEAAKRAAELLAEARAPVILGLEGSTNQAVAAALRIADRARGLIDPSSPMSLARSMAVARTGYVSATLGEVRNRADVVVFWGADPVRTHPRHWERYSVTASGRFIPEGRASRTVIVVDDRTTATADRANRFIAIDRHREFDVLWALRALVKGVELDADRVWRAAGLDRGILQELAGELRQSRYGAMFYTPPAARQTLSETTAVFEAAFGLVRELNRHTRFVILGMGEPGNRQGAEAVLTWQTGFPGAVDLGAGHPISLPGVTTAADRLKRGEVDVALIVGSRGLEHLDRARGDVPQILIAPPDANGPDPDVVAVRCRSARTGLEEAGTVMRADGIALPLRRVRQPSYPTERDWLEAIGDSLDRLVES